MRVAILAAFLALPASALAADPTALVDQLGHADPAVANAACQEIRALGNNALLALRAGLNHQDPKVQKLSGYLHDRTNNLKVVGQPWDPATKTIFGTDLEVWLEGDLKHVTVNEGAHRIHIKETASKLRVEITGEECGREVTEFYEATDPYALYNKHWGAFQIYHRWGGGIGTNWRLGSHRLKGKRLRVKGPILHRTRNSRFDTLRVWMAGQIKAAKVPKRKRRRVEKLMAEMTELWSHHGGTDQEKQDRMKRYLALSDGLRDAIKKAGLPDIGDLLPPPERLRLGINFTPANTGPGVVVERVLPDGRGKKLGLRVGDLVVKIGSTPVDSGNFTRVLRNSGDPLTLQIIRDGKLTELPAGKQP